MGWKRLGRVFVAEGQTPWMLSHAANPQSLHLWGDIYRVFFSVRDAHNRSHIAFVDLDLNRPLEVLSLSRAPVLSPGDIGLFDDSGVVPSCIVNLPIGVGLFFIGISLGKNVPFYSYPGLAILNDSRDSASRFSRAPILDRSREHPYAGGAVSILFDEERQVYRMWHEVCNGWSTDGGAVNMRLGIGCTSSKNGLAWTAGSSISLPLPETIEYFGSPCVLFDSGRYRMWYSFKMDGKYQIGYAESPDGSEWTLRPSDSVLPKAVSGWDSEEVAYPHVFRHGEKLLMLYCGNQYGRTGFGIAAWEEDR